MRRLDHDRSPRRTREKERDALTRHLTDSEQRWLHVHGHCRVHRHALAVRAADRYADTATVADTPLLTIPYWLPERPVPLDRIELRYTPDVALSGITGTEPAAQQLLPTRADGSRYARYSEAVAELAPPTIFENRTTYRLLHAELGATPRMDFGSGSYFDGIDVGDAVAHEYTAATLGQAEAEELRAAIGDPCDPARRPVNVAISTLTLRHDVTSGAATFPLHRRGAAVGHAAGMYQLLPVGIFQPAGDQPWNTGNDFSLWRCIVRELTEELRGQAEDYDTDRGPIDYDAWDFAARLTHALHEGHVQATCVGIGVDPLTFATDILTVVSIDPALYDELFGHIAEANDEGAIVPAVPFTAENIDRYAAHEPTQAAGAALLRLAWTHRSDLVG